MTHAELKETLGLYALGALEGADTAAVESHLRECRPCVAELVDLQTTAAELARAVAPLAPSDEVTHRILEAAEHALPSSTVRPARRSTGGMRPVHVRGASRPFRRLLRMAGGIGIAAVVAFLVFSRNDLQRRLDRATSTLARGGDLLEFMASPDVVTVSLAATGPVPAARALVSYDRGSGRVAVLAFHLPPPPAGHVYQLWRIAEDVRPAVVFSTEGAGGILLDAQWSPGRDVPLFAVTLEPSPGAADPAGKILLLGGVPRAGPAVGW